jgi:hypothetical protein
MTKDEKQLISSHGLVAGALGCAYFAGPLSLGIFLLGSKLIGAPGLLLLAWIIFGEFAMRHHRKLGKELLCATQWARSQGITPDIL